jgi:hypothetical protein
MNEELLTFLWTASRIIIGLFILLWFIAMMVKPLIKDKCELCGRKEKSIRTYCDICKRFICNDCINDELLADTGLDDTKFYCVKCKPYNRE